MYYMTNATTGKIFKYQSYDHTIEHLIKTFGEYNFTIKVDHEMPNVWWICVEQRTNYMLTNMEPASDVTIYRED